MKHTLFATVDEMLDRDALSRLEGVRVHNVHGVPLVNIRDKDEVGYTVWLWWMTPPEHEG